MIGPRTSVADRPHQVTCEHPGPAVPDGDGGFTQTWVACRPPTWQVAIRPATARDLERVAAGTVIATATHVISGPYHPQITIATRLRATGRTFDVTGVATPDERQVETIAVAVELLTP